MDIVQEELEIKETKSAGKLAKEALTTSTQETFSDVDIIEAE